MLKDGQVMRSGGVSVQTDTKGEWLLNVRYLQKNREGLIPAGHVVAKAQLALTEYQVPSMELKNVEESNQAVVFERRNERRYCCSFC